MISKVVVTYDFDDAKTSTFEGTPAVQASEGMEAAEAVAVDLSTIPAEYSAE